MSDLRAHGTLLTASTDDRTLTYLLLPYGSEGRTSLGRLTASQGSVTVPEDVATLSVNEEHDATRPVGRFTRVEDTEAGLEATVRLARTRAGDDALELAAEGLRTGISVEIANPVIRAGRLIAGVLTGAGLVVRPAFADAQLIACDCGDTDEEVEEETSEETQEINETQTEEETQMTAVPNSLAAAGTAAPEVSLETIAKAYKNRDARLAASVASAQDASLFAAFNDNEITHTDHTDNISPLGWLGELWSGKTYVRKYAPLISSGTLTSWEVKGWKFTAKPTVADYAGDLAEIASSEVTTVPYTEEASRIAGGWRVDRKFSDFGDTSFLQGLYSAAAEDYARKSDLKVITSINTNATEITGSSVPEGVNPGIARIVDGVLSMINFATPTFAVVATDVYRSILLTRNDDALLYLSSALGFEDGSIGNFRLVPSADLAAGTVIVGAKEALTLFELPGVPVRVDEIDVTHGGSNSALFGYYAIVVNDENGLVKVHPAA